MRRLAFSMPRFSIPLFLIVTLGLGLGACSHVAPEAQPAKSAPAVVAAPPPVSPPAPAPTVKAQPLPTSPDASSFPAPPTGPRPTQVAFLVPLSGPQAPLGAALFNAAQLALFEMADNNFNLLPFDTKGNSEGAAAAAQRALAQHVDLIVGPLFSGEAKAVAPLAKQAGVSVVSFTADRSAAGDGAFVLGFLPDQQALRAVEYAHSQGRNRLAILAPSNEYGRIVVDALSNNAQALGVTITSLQYYDSTSADLAGPIKRLIKKPGDPGFDCLLLPDEGQRLKNVAALLPQQGIDPAQIKLLGTMLWEESRTAPELVGGWYAVPPDGSHATFDAHYAKAFGVKPPRLASLGYDATALAAVLARSGGHDFQPGALTNPTGFAGVDGIFRLRPDGTAERGYAVHEIVAGGTDKEIAPAPAAFQTLY